MRTVTLYFVRHGQTYLNKYQRMQGWADSPLTPEGEAVAVKAGRALADLNFDAAYCSDLGRTIQTAHLILAQSRYNQGLNLIQKQELRESFFGYYEGESQERAYEVYMKLGGYDDIREMMAQAGMEQVSEIMKAADPFGEAETQAELWKRLSRGLTEIVSDPDLPEDARVLVVTHGNVIRNVFTHYDETISAAQEIENASVSTLVYEGGSYRVSGFNQVL